MSELYIGIMSGTSMDGIDAVLVDFAKAVPCLKRAHYAPFPKALRETLLGMHHSQRIDIQVLMDCDEQLGALYAEAVCRLTDAATLQQVHAIGCHGQTLWHRPPQASCRYPSSWQIGNPNIIVARTGIPTVNDFRRADMAAGGEGAPLVTAFHRQLFQCPNEVRAIVNIGGIANATLLDGDKVVHAFDTGPGNALMDLWVEKNKGMPFDSEGEWASGGRVLPELLKVFLADAYFSRQPPKSTGREYFNEHWLAEKQRSFSSCNAQDVQATLCELTALSIHQALQRLTCVADRVIICGGGLLNRHLFRRITALCGSKVHSSDDFGVSSEGLEAMAFAWLAKQRIEGCAGNVPATTGASKSVVLGALYAV